MADKCIVFEKEKKKKKKKGGSLALLKEYRCRVNAFREKDIGRSFMNNILRTK